MIHILAHQLIFEILVLFTVKALKSSHFYFLECIDLVPTPSQNLNEFENMSQSAFHLDFYWDEMKSKLIRNTIN